MLSPLSRLTRPTRVLAVTAILPLTVGLAGPVAAASATAHAPAAKAADHAHAAAIWQGSQLDPDGTIPSDFAGFVDWGLTVDTVFQLSADGQRPKRLASAASAVEDHYFTDYATFEGTISANAMSKTLVAAAVLHRNARNFGGHNLRQLVENRIAGPNAGLEQGRLRDKTTAALPHDFSNTFGQSYGVVGLARTAGGVPDEVVGYLLRQRCSEGFFRIFPVAGQTCDEGDADQSAPDVDATALAVQALITARDHGTTIPAGVIAGSVAWLRSVQKANGSFGGGASTPASNTNSTGLAAQALEAAGRHAPAVDAAGFVRRMQITAARAGNGPARIDLGAIALNRAGLNAALQDGLTSTTRGQFRRATPQAYFALNRVSLGELSAP